ncbi:unnamed protein product [Didymodactylos carnosus]|nr:unnamed protein product [Didymodactylos carnosus]CAF3796767.1 unnamed protein product [Didymodactylos carnosus]
MPDISSNKGLTTIKEEIRKAFYGQFTGDFTPLMGEDELKESTYRNVASCILKQDDSNPKYKRITSLVYNWLGTLCRSDKIDKIEIVFNSGRYRAFLHQLHCIEDRQDQLDFQPDLSDESSLEERKFVLERLDKVCKQVSHNRQVRMARMWHGYHRASLPSLLTNGFATLGKNDNGWYGKAMYFTASAKYARRYGNCLIMCYILILNPFPIVTDDAPPNVPSSTFRFYGKGTHQNYQCHYIPVAAADNNPNTIDYRPPVNGIDNALYDELAVFQEINILPQIVVHLQETQLRHASIRGKNNLCDCDWQFTVYCT